MKSPDGILERPSPKSASFKRKMLIALCILLLNDAEKPRKLVASFFEAFETGNFSTMKSYCSMNCKSKYFHDDDVYGMRKVKVKEYGEEEFYSDKFGTDFYSVYVTADVELASGKSTTKSFTIILLQDVGGNWSVHEFSDEEK